MPNLDYEEYAAGFQWESMYAEIGWLSQGGLNSAYEAIDLHASGIRSGKVALIWESTCGELETYTFGQLKNLTNQFANVLKSLGINRRDRVFVCLDRIPELYIAVFGILKIGAVCGSLSLDLNPDMIRDRLKHTDAKILVTQPDIRRRFTGMIPELFELQHIIVVNKNGHDSEPMEMADLSYEEEMAKASCDFDIELTSQHDDSFVHYEIDTTGKLRGMVHRHLAVLQQLATGKWVLDLCESDVYWCIADPGCAEGSFFGMLAPWTNGATQFVREGDFETSVFYESIEKHKVTVWYADPSSLHMLIEEGNNKFKRYDLSTLRHVCSRGEGLIPESMEWCVEAFDVLLHAILWQSETGAALIANYPGMDMRFGSMGRPMPGVDACIVDQNYNPVLPGVDGELAIRPGWPSMLHTYWNDIDAYNSRFHKGWYITGQRARMDEDGYFWVSNHGNYTRYQ